MSKNDDNSTAKWLIGAVIVPIFVACMGAGFFLLQDKCLPLFCRSDSGNAETTDPAQPPAGQTKPTFDRMKPADIFLSSTSGPGGSKVNVSGEGFAPNEQIVIMFHTEEIGRTQASSTGQFTNVTVTIPRSFSKFAPQKFDIIATGRSSIKSARTPFTISG